MLKILTVFFLVFSLTQFTFPSISLNAYQNQKLNEDYKVSAIVEDLIQLFHFAIENKDFELAEETISVLLKIENNNLLLYSISKYSEKGKVDFALHNAIIDKNFNSSLVMAYYLNNVNIRKNDEIVTTYSDGSSSGGISRSGKTPLELTLDGDMIKIIQYLLMKSANPYLMKPVGFIYEGEENIDYMANLGYEPKKMMCVISKKVFFPTTPVNFKRTFIGEAIAKNRFDFIEILQKMSVDWNKPCCELNKVEFTPLQFSLAIKRYEIAQFLLNHGAVVE